MAVNNVKKSVHLTLLKLFNSRLFYFFLALQPTSPLSLFHFDAYTYVYIFIDCSYKKNRKKNIVYFNYKYMMKILERI